MKNKTVVHVVNRVDDGSLCGRGPPGNWIGGNLWVDATEMDEVTDEEACPDCWKAHEEANQPSSLGAPPNPDPFNLEGMPEEAGDEITVELSPQSMAMLDKLAGYGIYGLSAEDVAMRFIDEALQRLAEKPKL